MNILKNPVIAILLCVLIVLTSTVVSINVKLNNKCEEIVDSFYISKNNNSTSIYGDIVSMYELAEEITVVADNYGVDTRKLSTSISSLKKEVSFHNPEIDDIHDAFSAFYNELWDVELKLSEIQLSQRHMEYMNSASKLVYELKVSIDEAEYNNTVRTFYKRFDRFPVNLFADIFDIDYPEYFA